MVRPRAGGEPKNGGMCQRRGRPRHFLSPFPLPKPAVRPTRELASLRRKREDRRVVSPACLQPWCDIVFAPPLLSSSHRHHHRQQGSDERARHGRRVAVAFGGWGRGEGGRGKKAELVVEKGALSARPPPPPQTRPPHRPPSHAACWLHRLLPNARSRSRRPAPRFAVTAPPSSHHARTLRAPTRRSGRRESLSCVNVDVGAGGVGGGPRRWC